MSHKKCVFVVLLISSLIAALVVYFGFFRSEHEIKNITIDGVVLTPPKAIHDFQLTDNHGKIFTRASLTGHWTILFFGFTNCGMVCPTTMSELNKMYQALEKSLPRDQMPTVVMVSVDPERDTIARMNSYLIAFNPNFIGIRGDIPETLAFAKQFGIAIAKMQAEGAASNNYSVNHSADLIIINPNAQVQAYLSYPHHAEKIIDEYKKIIGR